MKFPLKKSKVLIGVVAVILILVLTNVFRAEVKSFFYSFSAPIQKTLWRAGERSSDFLTGFLNQRYLKEKLNKLELKNQELIVQIEELKDLKKENELLRRALSLGLKKEFKLSLAQIIGKDISQDFILIDKGIKDGVLKDMPVITEEKVLVGKIYEVYENFSKVQLLSHKNSVFDTNFGLAKGQGNFNIFLELILKEKTVLKGDIVKSSALGGVFPQGLLVGKIQAVKKNDVRPFQQADVKPAFDISKTEKLFIILEF